MRRKILLLVPLVLIFVLSGCKNIGNDVFATGVWNGKTYVNKFAELELTIPDDWIICSNQEIDEMLSGISNKSEYLHYDAMARSEDIESNIIFMYEDLSSVIGNSDISEEQYLKALKQNFGINSENNMLKLGDEGLSEIIRRSSYKVTESRVVGNQYETLIGEKKYYVLPTEFVGFDVKQTFYTRKVGNYMVTILHTSTGNADEINFIE